MKDATGLKIAMLFGQEQYQMIGPFLECVLGTKEIYREPGLVAFKWHNNLLEAHGPGANADNFIFQNNRVVVSFEVNDLFVALSEAKKAGFNAISNIISESDNYSFAFVKLGEVIIGLYQHEGDN